MQKSIIAQSRLRFLQRVVKTGCNDSLNLSPQELLRNRINGLEIFQPTALQTFTPVSSKS